MKRILPFLIAFACAPAHAAPIVITCPQDVQVQQQGQAQSPWRVFSDTVNKTQYHVSDVSLYDGPPEQLAQLKPDNADTDDTGPNYWSTVPTQHLYVVCSYTNTSLRFARELPTVQKRCDVTFEGDEPLGISCE